MTSIDAAFIEAFRREQGFDGDRYEWCVFGDHNYSYAPDRPARSAKPKVLKVRAQKPTPPPISEGALRCGQCLGEWRPGRCCQVLRAAS